MGIAIGMEDDAEANCVSIGAPWEGKDLGKADAGKRRGKESCRARTSGPANAASGVARGRRRITRNGETARRCAQRCSNLCTPRPSQGDGQPQRTMQQAAFAATRDAESSRPTTCHVAVDAIKSESVCQRRPQTSWRGRAWVAIGTWGPKTWVRG